MDPIEPSPWVFFPTKADEMRVGPTDPASEFHPWTPGQHQGSVDVDLRLSTTGSQTVLQPHMQTSAHPGNSPVAPVDTVRLQRQPMPSGTNRPAHTPYRTILPNPITYQWVPHQMVYPESPYYHPAPHEMMHPQHPGYYPIPRPTHLQPLRQSTSVRAQPLTAEKQAEILGLARQGIGTSQIATQTFTDFESVRALLAAEHMRGRR